MKSYCNLPRMIKKETTSAKQSKILCNPDTYILQIHKQEKHVGILKNMIGTTYENILHLHTYYSSKL